MTNLPEHLQVIKTERTSSPLIAAQLVTEGAAGVSSEKSENSNIKERLNLHVKRRLCAQPKDTVKLNKTAHDNNNNCNIQTSNQTFNSIAMVTATKVAATSYRAEAKPHQNQQKVRRHYQKRKKGLSPANNQRKNITPSEPPGSPVNFSNNHGKSPEGAVPVLAVRKYRRRILTCGSEENNTPVASIGSYTINAVAGDGGEEDSQDLEIRQCRGSDKDKRFDILSLVLSMKKRALLQHPEVQVMLQKVVALYKT